MAELFAQPGRQEYGAAQGQQPDNDGPGTIVHVHAEVVGHRGDGQGDGQEGKLHQQLGCGQSQQGVNALPGAGQLAKGANDIQPVQYQ